MSKVSVGQPVPDFALPATGEKTIRLSDLRGKKVVLYFPRPFTVGMADSNNADNTFITVQNGNANQVAGIVLKTYGSAFGDTSYIAADTRRTAGLFGSAAPHGLFFKSGRSGFSNHSFVDASDNLQFCIRNNRELFIANVSSAPGSNPTGGGYLYVESGALKYRGSSGTVTTIANA